MNTESNQGASASALSWTPVVPLASDSVSPSDPTTPLERPNDLELLLNPTVDDDDSSSELAAPSSLDTEITLSMAPLSLDPLTPPTVGSAQRVSDADERADVLGDVEPKLAPLEVMVAEPAPVRPVDLPAQPEPAAIDDDLSFDLEPLVQAEAAAPVVDVSDTADEDDASDPIELKIAPLDIDDIAPIRSVPTTSATPAPATSYVPSQSELEPTPEPELVPEPKLAPEPKPTPEPAFEPVLDQAKTASPTRPDVVVSAPVDAAPAVAEQPTTTVPIIPSITTSAAAAASTTASGPNTGAQPNAMAADTGSQPTLAPAGGRASSQSTEARVSQYGGASEPETVSRREARKQAKHRKSQQRGALKAARNSSRSGGGGIALVLTLLLLVGLIAGAVLFGRPYLFPDDWDEATKPYAEAVELVSDTKIETSVSVERVPAVEYAPPSTLRAGVWAPDLPMWRSLGLASGPVTAQAVEDLLGEDPVAYYDSATEAIVVDASAPAEQADGAITEAMVHVLLAQEPDWSETFDRRYLDGDASTRAHHGTVARAMANSTTFGAGPQVEVTSSAAAFLPPVIEYRVSAPEAYQAVGVTADSFTALVASSVLGSSAQPTVGEGETIATVQVPTDRTFWYMVFAGYTDAATAYRASNVLVQASLSTAESPTGVCSYGTFSGTDAGGATILTDVLNSWAANAPAEMTPSVTVLLNGTLQLRSCDPGVGFDARPRVGVGREIARLRSVELTAAELAPVQPGVGADRVAAIDAVRESLIGLPINELGLEATPAESAERAFELVDAAGLNLVTSDLPVDAGEVTAGE